MMDEPTNNVPEHESVGSEGCVGSGECANTTTAIQVYHGLDSSDKIQLSSTITCDSIYSIPIIITTTNNENITDGQNQYYHDHHLQQPLSPQSSLTAADDLPKLLFCPFCNDDYKTNDAFDMELHVIREHREKLV